MLFTLPIFMGFGKICCVKIRKGENIMGFIIFLLLLGCFCLFVLVGTVINLFSSIFSYDKDLYEKELRRMYFGDEFLDRLDRINESRLIHLIDARQIYLYKHEKIFVCKREVNEHRS